MEVPLAEESPLVDEQEELPQTQSHRHVRLTAIGLLTISLLCGVALLAPDHVRSLQAFQVDWLWRLLGLMTMAEPEDDCWFPGVYYTKPSMMPETNETKEKDIHACQERCMEKYGCLHFTYWPDKSCYLTSSVSKLEATGLGYSSALSGPRDCDDLRNYHREFLTGSVFCDEKPLFAGETTGQDACEERCDSRKDCLWYSYWKTDDQRHWCRLTQHCRTLSAEFNYEVFVYKKKHTELQEAGLQGAISPKILGANGRRCSAYPACAAVNLTKGNCCPNNNRISLACCNATVAEAVAALKEASQPKTLFPTLPPIALNGSGFAKQVMS